MIVHWPIDHAVVMHSLMVVDVSDVEKIDAGRRLLWVIRMTILILFSRDDD